MTSNDESKDRARRPGTASDRYVIAVLGKALGLLESLEKNDEPTLTELSFRAGIPKATALRILANLEDRDYVQRDINGRYRLGLRLLHLGARVTAGIDVRTVSQPVMERLREEFDETVNLALPADDGIVYIDIHESAHGLRMAANVGMRDAYHSSALGKAILAQLPTDRADKLLGSEPFLRKTPKTLVKRADLWCELDRVHRQGFSIDDEENELGARCVGAPIFDHLGSCVGAISVSGPVSRLTRERADIVATSVVEAAGLISKHLGHWTETTLTSESPNGRKWEPATNPYASTTAYPSDSEPYSEEES